MIIALTGTPGTGKTTIAKILGDRYTVVHINDFDKAKIEYDEERDSYIVDMDYLREEVEKLRKKDEKIIVEGHYSHEFYADLVIVLRCHPEELGKRLKAKGYGERKIRENVEAEAMSLITSEAINIHGRERVYEVDTTGKDPQVAAWETSAIIEGKDRGRYKPRINYSEVILGWY